MKTRLIFLVLLIVCFACGTNNKPVSDAQKEKIKGEVKEVVNAIVKGAEEVNSAIVLESYLDSPDFVFLYNGKTFTYNEIANDFKTDYSTQINQKCTIVDEKFAVLDNTTVLYTTNCKWAINFKDGHSILLDPLVVQLLFRKDDDRWRVINCVESGIEQSVKNAETSKELNQVELMKQFAGTWKCESNDTTFTIEDKYYGGGHDVYVKWETKGKIIREMKTLVGYDKKNDILIESILDHNSPNMWLGAMRFTSTNKFEEIALEDISNPENATMKWIYKLKSPDLLIETYFQNNKVVSVHNYKRVK